MKKIALFGLLLAMASACQDNEEARRNLIGRWSYDVEAILNSARMQNPTENEMAIVQGAMSIYKDAVFEFGEDGSLIVITNGIEQRGTWELASDGSQLYINLSGQGQPNDILELSEKRLILAPIPESGLFYKRIFIPASAPRKGMSH